MSSQRVVQSTGATISFQGVDADGEPADPGTVTVGVVRSDGSTVIAAGTATSGTGTAARTVALTASNTADLDVLTATWTASGTVLGTTEVEIVGGVYLPVAEIRALETALDAGRYPTDAIIAARREVEVMFEDYCNRAFVPRFAVERLDGTGSDRLPLRFPDLRAVAWCRVWTSATVYTELTADQLAAIPPSPAGTAVRTDGWCWEYGHRNIEIAYSHGMDRPPLDMRRATVTAIRRQLNTFKSGLDSRATSFQPIEGGNVTLATPGVGRWATGVPEVDEVLMRYKFRKPSVR